jgi:eukaryotic-like serine/threonine-protein kinase
VDLPIGTILGSRYRVLRELGRGGMGAVYLAEHVTTGNHVALKVLHGAAAGDPDSVERFRREARAPAKIGSESVVKVLDADVAMELGGVPFLAMELLVGEDLQKLVRSRGRLHPQEVVNMLTQVARALDKSHAIGVVHRDLKPENIFLHQREDGTTVVKILDFGISKLVSAAMTSGGAMTRTGEVMGTPLYMSPEQAAGRVSLIGPASDVWSLGLIAVYLLTGETYFQGNTIPDVLAKVLGHAMYAPSRRWTFLPPAFDAWLMQSCAREPAARFRSAGEQMAALPMALQADAPTLQAISDLGMGPTIPRSGPVPSSVPRSAPVHTELAYGATMVGGSTNEPLIATRPPAKSSSAVSWVVLVVGVLVLFAGAAVVTIAVVMHGKDKDAQPPTLASSNVGDVPTVVLDLPDASLPALSTPTHVSNVPYIKPVQTGSVTSQPSASAVPSASTAPSATPKRDRQDCIDDCNDQFPDDMNAATACVKNTCPR